MRRSTLARGIASALLGAMLLAGCTSSSPSAGGSVSSPSPSAHPTSGPTPTPSPTPSPSPTRPGRCSTSVLSAKLLGTSGAAGSIGGAFAFINNGPSACTLFGYPGMQLFNATGNPLPTTVIRGTSTVVPSVPERTITLAPGGRAFFYFGYADVPTGSEACPTASVVEITPPNAYDHLVVTVTISPCGGRVTVSPVTIGKPMGL